jgi:hypothetical protein
MQADLYKLLDVPAVFLGNRKLGGIGKTLELLVVLWSWGYRIDAVVFIEQGCTNGDSGGEGGASAFYLVGRMQKPCTSTQQFISTSCVWMAIQ